ncbi:MAG: thermonuclease family protein [Mycoplasma sp.]|nr:thermonuclease family protein [Mycoplasma sp.]
MKLLNIKTKLISILSLLVVNIVFLVSSCSKESNITSNSVYITSCHDGDTPSDSTGQAYRILGIDTAEISHNYENFKQSVGLEHYWALKAKEFCEIEIKNKHVNLEKQKGNSYSRIVARIKYENKDYGLELIKKGLARVAYISNSSKNKYYYNDKDYVNKLINAEKKAKESKKGLWAFDNKIIFPKQKVYHPK